MQVLAHVDAHEPGTLFVVADQIDVGAKPVPVEQNPHENGDGNGPDHLHGKITADTAHHQRMKGRVLDGDERDADLLVRISTAPRQKN